MITGQDQFQFVRNAESMRWRQQRRWQHERLLLSEKRNGTFFNQKKSFLNVKPFINIVNVLSELVVRLSHIRKISSYFTNCQKKSRIK